MALFVVSVGASSGLSLALFGGIAIVLGLAVLVAHLLNPKVKRVVGATVLALFIAAAAVYAEDIIFVNPCDRLTPSDPMWWVLGCFWP